MSVFPPESRYDEIRNGANLLAHLNTLSPPCLINIYIRLKKMNGNTQGWYSGPGGDSVFSKGYTTIDFHVQKGEIIVGWTRVQISASTELLASFFLAQILDKAKNHRQNTFGTSRWIGSYQGKMNLPLSSSSSHPTTKSLCQGDAFLLIVHILIKILMTSIVFK